VGALDQRVYVVIPAATVPTAPAQDGSGFPALLPRRRRRSAAGRHGDEAGRVLAERCDAIREGLARAGVHAWRLDTPALRALCYRRLCPRTARMQPFDRRHADPIAMAAVLFAQVSDDAPQDGEGDEEDGNDDDDA